MRQLEGLSPEPSRPGLHLAPAPPTESGPIWHGDEPPIELKVTFRQLTLIHKSLKAAKTLGADEQDELFDDTIHLVDLALGEAV